jgi:hypothetical protein
MATITVNGLTLTHKGSGGMSIATLPDLCLTPAPPGPPMPIPYPNMAMSADLMQGTTTVTADGGNMIATKGSIFMKSTGDEPGINGGVMSAVNMKETHWLTFSMDVTFDGDNACRLTDKTTHNHQNTVNMAGELEGFLLSAEQLANEDIKFLCELLCTCLAHPDFDSSGRRSFQGCVDKMLKALEEGNVKPGYSGKKYPNITSEQGYEPGPDGTPIPTDGKGYRAPDAIVKKDPSEPPSQENIEYLVEMKFWKGDYCDVYSEKQQKRDQEIVGKGNKKKIAILTPKSCGCPPDPTEPDHSDDPTKSRCADVEDGAEEGASVGQELGVESFTGAVILAGMALAEFAAVLWAGLTESAGAGAPALEAAEAEAAQAELAEAELAEAEAAEAEAAEAEAAEAEASEAEEFGDGPTSDPFPPGQPPGPFMNGPAGTPGLAPSPGQFAP